jgi:hypothetical protein
MISRATGRYGVGALLLIVSIGGLPVGLAVQSSTPTLDEILSRLETNLSRYDRQVPDFFCNEHVVSLLVYGKKQQSTVTDSVFRVERTATGELEESRDVKAINGTVAEGRHIGGPVILSGVFSGGLDPVSLRQKACMSYTLRPVEAGAPYVIEFATLPDNRRRRDCSMWEDGSGRVLVDPATMQVTRMELEVPHHTIMPTESGTWKIAVDYGRTEIAGQTFWMPATISSTATPSEAYTPTLYSFSAKYSEYHKLEVRSRIVPAK